MRVVNYVADGLGFRAAISSNEPGVAPQLHQAATISKPVAAVVAAPLIAAPAVAAPVYASPVYASHGHYVPAAAAIAGPAAYAPAYAPGLLAAPVTSYVSPAIHPYPIRR